MPAVPRILPRLVAATLALVALPAGAQAPKGDAPKAEPAKADELPAPPTVTDPLLDPPPPAGRVVATWQDALALVKARSVDFQVALGDLERARAQARVALAGSLPTLTGSANVTNTLVRTRIDSLTGERNVETFPSHATTYGGSLNLNIPIFVPRAWFARGTAKVNERVAELALADQKRALAATVASAMVAVVVAERVADLNRSGLRASLERLALAKRRAELGAATAIDVLRLEQDANQARSSVVSGDENLRRAREQLGLALGFTEAWGVPRELSLDALAKESEQACPKAQSVEERTDVQVAAGREEAARRGIRDIELAFSPTVAIVTSYSINSQFYNAPTNPVTGTPLGESGNRLLHTWTIGGVLSWNIFDGGVRYGQLRDARAVDAQAKVRLEGVRRAATLEVVQAARKVTVATDALKLAEDARRLSRDAEKLTRSQFALGRATSLELLDAARALRDAEVQMALKELDVVDAKIRAMLAMATCTY